MLLKIDKSARFCFSFYAYKDKLKDKSFELINHRTQLSIYKSQIVLNILPKVNGAMAYKVVFTEDKTIITCTYANKDKSRSFNSEKILTVNIEPEKVEGSVHCIWVDKGDRDEETTEMDIGLQQKYLDFVAKVLGFLTPLDYKHEADKVFENKENYSRQGTQPTFFPMADIKPLITIAEKFEKTKSPSTKKNEESSSKCALM